MHRRPRKLASAVGLVTAAALSTALVLPPSVAASPPMARHDGIVNASTGATPAQASTVTLITGDTVSLTKQPDGKVTTLIRPGPGRDNVVFSTRVIDQHVHVVPADAGGLVARGRLDKRLFDVTQLAAFGYDDAKTASLPLIVTGTGAAAGRRIGKLDLAGARVARDLPSIGGRAVVATKQRADEFWQSLTGGIGTTTPRAFAVTGVGKVWLDGKAEIRDAESNAQIGVPAAHQAGYDGRGVTVAVLDSGVDATHPDLKEVIGETKDFTDSPEGTKDVHGHGTHVASIIAGTGARTAKYAGVAPRAKVIVGKVCGAEDCPESAIIAGMEWAAPRARVVNLSLGTAEGTDGTDPIAQSVNKLTAATGTLFVAAAGNSYSPYTVGSPASADAALAVASVDKKDVLSAFSSHGPRVGDHSVKPDIAAPGEDIVATRAAGTAMGRPVDDSYTAADGTSMASPHVAGAAAILAQAHPGWKADKLKAALMSSSAALPKLGVFAQGAGRVDIARAVTQQVFAQASLSFPYVTWPYSAGKPVTKAVTYRNEGSSPVTLNLTLSTQDSKGGPGPAGLFTLGAPTVTVPAGGSADAVLTLDPTKLTAGGGTMSARITATGPGGLAVQTAAGVAAEPESYTIEVTVLDRNGKLASGKLDHDLYLANHTREVGSDSEPDVVNGVAKVRVPKGDYGVIATTATGQPGKPDQVGSTTLQILSKYTIKSDQRLTLDARKGNKIGISVADRPEAVRKTLTADFILDTGPGAISGGLFVGNGDKAGLHAVPAKAAPGTKLAFGLSAVLGAPLNAKRPYQYYLTALAPVGTIPSRPTWRVRTADLAQATVRFRAQGKPALAEVGRAPFYLPEQFFGFGAWTTVAIPATRTEYWSPQPVQWSSDMAFQRPADQPELGPPTGYTLQTPRKVNAGQRFSEEWNSAVVAPSLALSPNYSAQIVRVGGELYASVPMFSPSTPGTGNLIGFQLAFARGDTTLSRGGTQIGASGAPGSGAFSGLPPEKANYTLFASATRTDPVPWSELSTRTQASWTFNSAATAGEATWLPLMYLRTTGAFDDLNRAPAGRFNLSLAVERQPRTSSTAKVKEVTLEYSADDGKTWTKARVACAGATWRAEVINPPKGFVSLRAGATDSAGDSHEITVIRAYGIK